MRMLLIRQTISIVFSTIVFVTFFSSCKLVLDGGVHEGNLNLAADFFVTPEVGNSDTVYTFDASISVDDADDFSQLLYRWDYNNDGVWDTEYINQAVSTYTFGRSNI